MVQSKSNFKNPEDQQPLLQNELGQSIIADRALSSTVTNFSSLLPKPPKDKPPGIVERISKTRFGKAFPWITSKGVVRAINIAVPAIAFSGLGALSGGIVPAVALGIAGTTMLFNSIRDTRSLRILKKYEQEHQLLQEYQLSKRVEDRLHSAISNKTGVDFGEQDKKSDSKTTSGVFKSKYEDGITSKSLFHTIRDSAMEAAGNIATVAVVATSGLANAAAHALSVGLIALPLTILDIGLSTIERRKMKIIKRNMRGNIETLSEGVPHYGTMEDLEKITQKQRNRVSALQAVLTDSELSKDNVRDKVEIQEKSLAEYTPPIKRSFWDKTKQYFKDFNQVHWPSDYNSAVKFAAKLDKKTTDMLEKYDALLERVPIIEKAPERAKRREISSSRYVNAVEAERSARTEEHGIG